MAVVYHWKHGWIPLDHIAALSKAKGSEKGANKYLGLHPVSQNHVGREGHVVVGHHERSRRFVIHDRKSGHTGHLSEADAHAIHQRGGKITGVNPDGSVASTGKLSWKSAPPPDGGSTPFGQRVAKQVKQSFTLGNHEILIESNMTKAQTKDFLDAVSATIERAGVQDKKITWRVPTGDTVFRAGRVAGYVRRGQRTVHVAPTVANGKMEVLTTSWAMPAAEKSSMLRYTLTHELGHVVDGIKEDTMYRTGAPGTAPRFELDPDAKAFFEQHKADLSTYGRSKVVEGYAEAFAQWNLGGPGSNPAADAYAKEYGWH